jgi:nucleolar GTP-binding protein
MNFQDLKKVETPDTYLDIAFGKAAKRVETARQKKSSDRMEKSKFIETTRIDTVVGTLSTKLQAILISFPSIDNLPPFYKALVKETIDYALLKKSLGAVNWAEGQVKILAKKACQRIMKTKEFPMINKIRKETYGRISSVLKQIKKELLFLEEARKTMKGFPTIKTNMFTVCICGFPNIGKSTLLSKLTTSTPEINNYAFTTKSLNTGYLKEDKKKIQFIDTPGTLNREKSNTIENHAHLAMKYCAHAFIYIFDLTEPYPLKDQTKLLKQIAKDADGREILIYLSKTDIVDENIVSEFTKTKQNVYTNIEQLKKKLLKDCTELPELEKQEE